MMDSATTENKDFIERIRPHLELAYAVISGVLILIGWYLLKTGESPAIPVVFLAAYAIGGYYKAKQGFFETFRQRRLNVELLMILAAVGSAIIGYWTEGAILIFIFGLSGALETYTMNKNHKEISALMSLQPEEAIRLEDGKEELVPVSMLVVGDILLVKPGERVPTDAVIAEGTSAIDEAAITGESIPVTRGVGDEVFAGTVNLRGTLKIRMTKASDETLFSKIIKLVQNAQSEKSPSQQTIEKYEGTYVSVVLVSVVLMMFLPSLLFQWTFQESFYRAMVLLVVASPCALVASVTPATLAAIANGAKNGILFKGGVHLENLSKIKAVAFDKTGTLTKGKPEVTDVVLCDHVDREEFLLKIAEIERYSTHPLAGAVVNYVRSQTEKEYQGVITEMEDVPGFGVKAKLDGVLYKLGNRAFVDGEQGKTFMQETVDILSKEGKTVIYVRDEEMFLGIIALKDVVREDAILAVEALHKLGIKSVMLTGDHERTAEAIARETGIDLYIAGCLPERKADEIKKLEETLGKVAMVGDGINDAPALATATVGISMGEGTDVAMETADVVLMKNYLPRIADTVKLSKKMNRIVKQNMLFSVLVILMLITSNFLQQVNLPIGVVFHEGSTILVILNGLRLLKN